MIDNSVSYIELTVHDNELMAIRTYWLKLRLVSGSTSTKGVSFTHEMLDNVANIEHLADNIATSLADGIPEIKEKIREMLLSNGLTADIGLGDPIYQIINYQAAPAPGTMVSPAEVDHLPALCEYVKDPVTGSVLPLKTVIILLNDFAMWTREEIADWLESLDIDIEFKIKEVSNE